MTSRRTLDQTRFLLLETGARMLADDGFTVGIDGIKMIDVCRRAGLKTAGSAYKIWPTQTGFREALLHHLVAGSDTGIETVARLVRMLETSSELPQLDDLVRQAADAVTVMLDTAYPTYLMLWLARAVDTDLARAAEPSEAEWSDILGGFLTRIMELYDLEFVPPFDVDVLGVSLSALAEGLTLIRTATPELVPAVVDVAEHPGCTGGPWTPLAFGLKAIVDAYTRPRQGCRTG